MSAPLADDSPGDIEQRQIDGWRRMTPAQKADLIVTTSQAARDMALAGIRERYPNATPREHFLRLAILTLGLDLARRAYPEIDSLDLS